MKLFRKIGNKIKKRAIKKASKKIEAVATKTAVTKSEEDMQKMLLTLAITILEKLGKKYIEAVQKNIEKDGFQVDDLLGSLKKEVKKK